MNGYFRLNTFIRDFILIYTGSRYKWIFVKYYSHTWNKKTKDFGKPTLTVYAFKLNAIKSIALSKNVYKKLLCAYPQCKYEYELYRPFNGYVTEWYGENDKLFIDVTDSPRLTLKQKHDII